MVAVRPKGGTVERELDLLASAAQGIVTRAELLAQRVTPAEIKHRLGTGGLIREYRGVYRVGHRAPSTAASYLAAVRACGDGALLSGLAAAHLLGLIKGPAPPPEVTTRSNRRMPGIIIHRCRRTTRARTIWDSVPVTAVPEILVDVAARLSIEELARTCHEARVRFRTTPAQVEAALARRPRTAGAADLRRVLRGDVHLTLSKLERCFVAHLREHNRLLPETNKPAGGRYVDCRWPSLKLTVELDSYTFHGSRHAWEQDRRREREARARGDDFRRYTWGDVVEHPAEMLSELLPILPSVPPSGRRTTKRRDGRS